MNRLAIGAIIVLEANLSRMPVPLIFESIRVRGLVQGVGFRPTVWRLARDCGLSGDVRNDGAGVLIRLQGQAGSIEDFVARLVHECPPLARIDALERSVSGETFEPAPGFRILASDGGEVHTGIVADAATCAACRDEIFDPANRRFRYPFTNCTHCGPRLSIVNRIPYDRANTSMVDFPMCPACEHEYSNPADRRFHAQPNACAECGPRVWLVDALGVSVPPDPAGDAIATASRLMRQGRILAIKGIGGFHLACDACNVDAVALLRWRKRRYRKPFALMARDLAVIDRYCRVDPHERTLLRSSAAPVVLLAATQASMLAADVAPGQATLGFMLPYSPLHHLLLETWDTPLVMTSGNLSDEPQCTANDDAARRLDGIADFYLLHDREIVNRVDDSVVRVMDDQPRLLRRARGYAPSPLVLPAGFGRAAPVLALGGELKNTLCLLKDGQAVLSQHLGDLEDARTADDYERTVDLYSQLFQHQPRVVAVDLHPDYRSTRYGQVLAEREGLELISVQHHFAHIASVLADCGHALDAGPVIGVALDGLGFGTDGTIWGGEFLLADYRGFRRVAHLAPTPMPGGARAILEPWRNSYAHLVTHVGWERFTRDFGATELADYWQGKPLDLLGTMIARAVNAPPSSSCGRLFDAVAGVLGVCREAIAYEGQAAIELEVLASGADVSAQQGYPFAVNTQAEPWLLDPAPMWLALLTDLQQGVPSSAIAARFHAGLADAVAGLARSLTLLHGVDTVALSGGVLQNKTLFEAVVRGLTTSGLQVLSHTQVPTNDGGLSLGQAVVAAARGS